MSDSLVIIPTYNEKENISKMLDTVMSLNPSRGEAFDVLVVDDGSPDGTGDLVREAQAAYPNRIHLLERSGKLGLGTAYIAGFKWGLSKGYDYLFEWTPTLATTPRIWSASERRAWTERVWLWDLATPKAAQFPIGPGTELP